MSHTKSSRVGRSHPGQAKSKARKMANRLKNRIKGPAYNGVVGWDVMKQVDTSWQLRADGGRNSSRSW